MHATCERTCSTVATRETRLPFGLFASLAVQSCDAFDNWSIVTRASGSYCLNIQKTSVDSAPNCQSTFWLDCCFAWFWLVGSGWLVLVGWLWLVGSALHESSRCSKKMDLEALPSCASELEAACQPLPAFFAARSPSCPRAHCEAVKGLKLATGNSVTWQVVKT